MPHGEGSQSIVTLPSPSLRRPGLLLLHDQCKGGRFLLVPYSPVRSVGCALLAASPAKDPPLSRVNFIASFKFV